MNHLIDFLSLLLVWVSDEFPNRQRLVGKHEEGLRADIYISISVVKRGGEGVRPKFDI